MKRARAFKEISPPPLRRRLNQRAQPTPQPAAPTASNKPSPLSPPPQNRSLQIFFWNINGTSHVLPQDSSSGNKKITSFFSSSSSPTTNKVSRQSNNYSSRRRVLRDVLKEHNWPGIICLQEVKIAPNDEKGKCGLEDAANRGNEGRLTPDRDAEMEEPGNDVKYKAYFSLPRDKHNARGLRGKGKVHGVCTLVREDLLNGDAQNGCRARAKIEETGEVDWDLEGRVLITSFSSPKLVVVNGYWVNGTTNPYRDPDSGETVGTRHDRKRGFHASMLEEVKKWERNGYVVILVGDMNVAPQLVDGYPGIRLGVEHVKNRQDFNEKFLDKNNLAGMKGVDVWRHLRGAERKYTYHGEREEDWGSSCDRVDLAIVSQELVNRNGVINVEIWEDPNNRNGSDHCPVSLWVDIDSLE